MFVSSYFRLLSYVLKIIIVRKEDVTEFFLEIFYCSAMKQVIRDHFKHIIFSYNKIVKPVVISKSFIMSQTHKDKTGNVSRVQDSPGHAKQKCYPFFAWCDQESPVLSKRCQFYLCDVIKLLEITTGFTILLLTVRFNVLFIS